MMASDFYVFWEVTVPVTPDRRITPNSAAHHMTKYKYQQALKNQTIRACEGEDLHMPPQPTPPLILDYVIAWEKGRRMMDPDNAKASMKYIQDGIAHVLDIDDKHMDIGELTQTRDPNGLGFVQVIIREDRSE